jgi:AmmeMemoRadiSam system protein B
VRQPIRLFYFISLLAFSTWLVSVDFSYAERTRPPVWAGKFYPGSSSELFETIRKLVQKADETTVQIPQGKTLKALILPHAGYIYSGWTAAHSHSVLMNRHYECVIVMGPDHRIGFSNAAISDASEYSTPLGSIRLDRDSSELIRSGGGLFHSVPASDSMEHSIEVVLPFLQYSLKDFKLVPIVFGRVGDMDLKSMVDKIAGKIDSKTLLVASSDLSHYLPYDSAVKRDKETIRMILKLEGNNLRSRENAACGVIPISVITSLADRFKWEPRLLHYSNSGDTAGPKDRVVGYAAIAFYGDNK